MTLREAVIAYLEAKDRLEDCRTLHECWTRQERLKRAETKLREMVNVNHSQKKSDRWGNG